ncbi:OmpA family protein [Allomuricauda sp. ARW1Y1]|jgi:outer membrane protein OmpA-like peptidoglycan-associated protein/tetratricopeptide (TPR) repeat protein|uniref:OmpA family protein n=1 Tax=Allomuricauda sp. ARW1Y1 TaxID=2663843 RepID=UPI0015CC278E|nr:OmpA family protein [Muricauda sp. ARW1Y1]NYJ28859.1 outer membrane protein OmpA-like peptidoglycan-associated protein/tetratricopeptide (TPR) repeat protein [Muricauda sp. ARW1Y1]
MNSKNIIYILFAICTLQVGLAQESKIKKANEDFFNFDYIDARKIYLSVVEDGYSSAQVYKKLGDTYYFNSEYADAATWYLKLVDTYPNEVESEYYYRAAQSLKSIGKLEESKSLMEKYMETSGATYPNWDTYQYLASTQNNQYQVKNITDGMNGSDFGPSYYGDKIVFASSSIDTEGSKIHDWNGLPYLDLFEAEIDENGQLKNIQKLEGDINSPYHESSAVFTKDGKTIYFTRNNYINGKKKRGKERLVTLKIYRASLQEDGTWGNVVELPFNEDSYSTAHPALNPEENRLYFSSNRNGSLGASDIWYVDILGNGNYGQPVNLGSKINTKQRESFPFICKTGDLYFASDGHTGLGGLDIFVVSLNETGPYPTVTNLKKPINSNLDDFGYVMDETGKMGYISSNRFGGQGSSSDDILAFTADCKVTIQGMVTDAKTGAPLQGAQVLLLDNNSDVVAQKIVDVNGRYDFGPLADCNDQYAVRASFTEKEYEPSETVVQTKSGTDSMEVNLQLTPPDCPVDDLGCRLSLQPIYFDFDKHNIRPDAEVELAKILNAMEEYPQLNIHIESHTDSRGNDDYNMQLSERRAKSTLEWLVSKGIDRNRLSAKGYGESQLINNCSNGVNCSQEEHQLNRRSMFIIK